MPPQQATFREITHKTQAEVTGLSMLPALKSLAIVLVAMAMAPVLAHALELPGKIRLSKEQYLAVQQIYYLGFTIGGAAEPLALLATLSLVFLTPAGDKRFTRF